MNLMGVTTEGGYNTVNKVANLSDKGE